MSIPNDASLRQIQAARPDMSTWLAANAGSGKTRVLTDRVARLLLSGVPPERILCLTYTKAAASEMQNRLFQRLGDWAMKPEPDLRKELIGLGVDDAWSDRDLNKARRLFARAIEAPGGLKIQTIHSFCATLLRRFPLEAGVSPQFTEMEDRAGVLLRESVLDDIATGPNRHRLDALAMQITDQDFEKLARDIIKNKSLYATALSIEDVLDLPSGTTEKSLVDQAFGGSEGDLFTALIPILRTSSANDTKLADALDAIKTFDYAAISELAKPLLFHSGANNRRAKIGRAPTKAIAEKHPELTAQLHDLMERIEKAQELKLKLDAAHKTKALHAFARVFLPKYEAAKTVRGWLDFDDLIEKTNDLLSNQSMASWVLFRLDGGIDHILVDEAQDTSPTQWSVIENLASEFTSGLGARDDVERTIFVVGDPKQSIYSFQGAKPAGFSEMRDSFQSKLQSIQKPFQPLQLEYSFRSSAAVLSSVDKVFSKGDTTSLGGTVLHKAFKTELAGRVDIFPVVEPQKAEDDLPWHTPLDRKSPQDATVILAKRIAARIRHMIDTKASIPDEEAPNVFRPVNEGDFLILVRKRSAIFHELIRACKTEGLKIAGADKLKIAGELAVKDLTALLAFLSTPEDDLALAGLLKSPLFGWSEQDLFDLAHRRAAKKYLWQEMRDRRTEFPETMEVLDDLRNSSDFLRPFDLLERALTRHDGRRKLISRLGEEAIDGIDALLDQAQSYEQNDVPNLTGFLTWLEAEDVEIKRQAESAGDQIRVMTIHGAKGLEAPIVILPETSAQKSQFRDPTINKDGTAVWKSATADMPECLEASVEEAKRLSAEESDRLLYVAMTRAEKWLMIDGVMDPAKTADTWYGRIEGAVTELGAKTAQLGDEAPFRFEVGTWTATDAPAAEKRAPSISIPAYMTLNPTAPEAKQRPLSPSMLGGAKALYSGSDTYFDEEATMRRGTLIHLLLEYLPDVPRPAWREQAKQLLLTNDAFAVGPLADEIIQEAINVLTAPHLEFLFSDHAMAEVGITSPLSQLEGKQVLGTIDRLIDQGDHILAVDFKSNAIIPERPQYTPLGLLRQMGAYAAALEAVFPNKPIKTALLWTRTAKLMELPHDMVMQALETTPIS